MSDLPADDRRDDLREELRGGLEATAPQESATTESAQRDAVLSEPAPSRGALLRGTDLQDLTIRDSDVSRLRIIDCFGDQVSISGALGAVIVDDVDVTAYVRDVLDARCPVRRLAREAMRPEQFQHAWDEAQQAWGTLLNQVRRSPVGAAYMQVNGEWSLVQTLRHLRFAADAWIGTAVLGEPRPHHPWGLPADGTAADVIAGLGLELDAAPGLEDVLAVRDERHRAVEQILGTLTEQELDRVCERTPGPGYPEREYTVRSCLRVLLTEEAEHLRYMLRDQATPRSAPGSG